MSSRARAHIRLSALRHNLQRVQDCAPESQIMAAIKADAYGHGALQVARALDGAHALAVATLEEAMQLRWHGEQRPIVLLAGVQSLADLRQAAEHKLQVVLHDDSQLPLLAKLEPVWPLELWFKLDTGMHRLGFAPDRARQLAALIETQDHLKLCGWMSHFASADVPSDSLTSQQWQCFEQAVSGLPGAHSLANSAAILTRADTHADWVRPGIMLYGACPLIEGRATDHDLQAVMSLRSELIAVHDIAAGEGIGYGQTWTCPEAMPVGVVGLGYGDGYPRHAPNGTPVGIHGRRLPLIGRVSMDMICVDLRECPHAQVGDEVELWGESISVDEVARAAGTISYELFCRLSSRVEFIYE